MPARQAPAIANATKLPTLPPVDPATLKRLEADIVAIRRVEAPIVVTPDVPTSIRRQGKRSPWTLVSFKYKGKTVEGVIVDGVERWRIAHAKGIKDYQLTVWERGLTEEYLAERRIVLNAHRRQLTRQQGNDLIASLLALGMSKKKIVRDLGVSKNRVIRVERGGSDRPPASVTTSSRHAAKAMDVMGRLETPPKGHGSLRTAQRRASEEQRAKVRKSTTSLKPNDRYEWRTCDFEALPFADGKADLVIADPVYGETEVYGRLGKWAARVLRPGGLLLCFSGTAHYDHATAKLGKHLAKVWTLATIRPPFSGVVRNKDMFMPEWEPIHILCKGEYVAKGGCPDVVRVVGKQQKTWHTWQKEVELIKTLIERFSKPGDLIVDPTFGSATSLIATLALNKVGGKPRRWVGCDRDPGCANLLTARVSRFLSGKSDEPE